MDGMRRHVWYEMAWYGMGHRPSPPAALVHRRRSSSPPSLPSLSDPLVADRCRRARATTPPRSRTQKGRAQLAQLEKKGTATQRVATPAIVTVCTSERPACGSKNLRRPGRAAPVALTKSPEPKAWTESLDRKPGPKAWTESLGREANRVSIALRSAEITAASYAASLVEPASLTYIPGVAAAMQLTGESPPCRGRRNHGVKRSSRGARCDPP